MKSTQHFLFKNSFLSLRNALTKLRWFCRYLREHQVDDSIQKWGAHICRWGIWEIKSNVVERSCCFLKDLDSFFDSISLRSFVSVKTILSSLSPIKKIKLTADFFVSHELFILLIQCDSFLESRDPSWVYSAPILNRTHAKRGLMKRKRSIYPNSISDTVANFLPFSKAQLRWMLGMPVSESNHAK